MKKLLPNSLYVLLIFITVACSKTPLSPLGDLALPTDSSATVPADTTPPVNSSFYFGVNGHPINQEAYLVLSPTEQIRLIRSLGMNIYRIDLPIRSNGMIKLHERYVDLKKAADSAGVTLLPMLPPANMDYHGSTLASYESGYERGRNFASIYKDDFLYYNIANELDNKCILPEKSGTAVNHYDLIKFNIIAAQLKGMNDGIKSVDKDAKTIINACWMHYRYLLMLEEYGVDFDIIGYHWYDEMERLAAKSHGIADITQFLSQKFSKPIWFTEINVRNNTGAVEDEVQRNFLNNFILKCQKKKNPQVQAALIYELFNQPVFESLESHYGLFNWSKRYTAYVPKLWAQEQRETIAARP